MWWILLGLAHVALPLEGETSWMEGEHFYLSQHLISSYTWWNVQQNPCRGCLCLLSDGLLFTSTHGG